MHVFLKLFLMQSPTLSLPSLPDVSTVSNAQTSKVALAQLLLLIRIILLQKHFWTSNIPLVSRHMKDPWFSSNEQQNRLTTVTAIDTSESVVAVRVSILFSLLLILMLKIERH